MKNILYSTLLVLFLFTIGAFAQKTDAPAKPAPTPTPAPTPAASDLSGKWNLLADAGGQVIDILVEIKQTGDTFTGTTSSAIGNGTIEGGKVTGKTFKAMLKADVQGQMVDFTMEGAVADGPKMTGSFANAGFGTVPFSAAKEKK